MIIGSRPELPTRYEIAVGHVLVADRDRVGDAHAHIDHRKVFVRGIVAWRRACGQAQYWTPPAIVPIIDATCAVGARAKRTSLATFVFWQQPATAVVGCCQKARVWKGVASPGLPQGSVTAHRIGHTIE